MKKATKFFCSRQCVNEFQVGANNPFWDKTHSKETKERVSNSRKGKCSGNQNAKGYRHTTEAKKRISEASKHLWETQRDKMVNSLPRGVDHIYHKQPELRRHRKEFTPVQRKEWSGNKCSFCGSTEFLELDHIIPIFDGGKNIKENAQTLCRGCNLWKIHYVDLPRYYAALAIQGDANSSKTS